MQTTCKSASLGPWPAAAILSDAYLLESTVLHKERLKGVFHAGVGGDKYEISCNCLHGGEERQLPRLLDTLQPVQHNIKL
jgi:hypothetical protein